MTAIQRICIFLLLAVIILYFRKLRSSSFDRLIISLIGILGIGLVASPDLTNRLAHWVGAGRGVDLVIYLALFGLGFSLLLILSKLRDLEAGLTEVARTVALANARSPSAGLDTTE